jgi:hypothetical protein
MVFRHQKHQALDGHHLEVFLTGTALWASPVNRDITPSGARRNAMLRITRCFIINPAANEAHPSFHLCHNVKVLPIRMHTLMQVQIFINVPR